MFSSVPKYVTAYGAKRFYFAVTTDEPLAKAINSYAKANSINRAEAIRRILSEQLLSN